MNLFQRQVLGGVEVEVSWMFKSVFINRGLFKSFQDGMKI